MTHPWTVRAWPPVLWQATHASELRLSHISTHVLNPGEGGRPGAGQTIWARTGHDGDAGLAWDWIQVTPGVVAMADPMSLVTNLRFIGDEGEVLTAWEAARHLNLIVHGLPWQDEVRRALCTQRPARERDAPRLARRGLDAAASLPPPGLGGAAGALGAGMH